MKAREWNSSWRFRVLDEEEIEVTFFQPLAPLLLIAAVTAACGEEEQSPPLNTAEAVLERQAEVLEEAAEQTQGAQQKELIDAAEAHRVRAEELEERPGEVAAIPVIVDSNKAGGVEGTAWKFEEKKEAKR